MSGGARYEAGWPLPLLPGVGARNQLPQLATFPDRYRVEAGLPEAVVVHPAVVEDVDRAAAGGLAGGLDARRVVGAVAGGGPGCGQVVGPDEVGAAVPGGAERVNEGEVPATLLDEDREPEGAPVVQDGGIPLGVLDYR